jgi:hypothetical protein
MAVVDNAGAESTVVTLGDTMTNWNKLKIEIAPGNIGFGIAGYTCRFYLNEEDLTNIPTALFGAPGTLPPSLPWYPNFYLATGAGGAATIELGQIRIWQEDQLR